MVCAKCGFPVDPKHHVHSRYTGLDYCSDLDDCDRKINNDLTYEETIIMFKRILIGLELGQFDSLPTYTKERKLPA